MAAKRFWTRKEDVMVRALYPHVSTDRVADLLDRRVSQVYQRAAHLGLKKSDEYLASPQACRLRRGDNVGAAFRFGKGHVPANKGLRRPGWAPGRMSETQFKKGSRTGAAARNWVPVGTIKADTEGYQRVKVRESNETDKCFGFGNTGIWPLLQRHVWEQHRGPIPAGHALCFKDGDRSNCAIENLELVSRADLMRRNTIHKRYPEELRKAIMLLGAVKRKVREQCQKTQSRTCATICSK